jgi:LuxR family maltose regulon positive regulatory protein
MIYPFIIHPEPDLLRRHARHSTAYASAIARILGLLTGASQAGPGSPAAPPSQPRSLRQPLSQAETRVLRYLPTSLTVSEIAGELYLSANTVRTHLQHIYDKLGAHRRHEVVDRARALGLLAPSPTAPDKLTASGAPAGTSHDAHRG